MEKLLSYLTLPNMEETMMRGTPLSASMIWLASAALEWTRLKFPPKNVLIRGRNFKVYTNRFTDNCFTADYSDPNLIDFMNEWNKSNYMHLRPVCL